MMPATAPKPIKVYVAVKAAFAADGTLLPRIITWEDGEKFAIDKIIDIRQAAAMKAGGQGDRYTLEICGQIRYLFFEHNCDYGSSNLGRWFMEWKDDYNETE